MTKILTVNEVAERLGVHSSRVRVLIRDGRLPAEKFGRDWQIKEKDLKLVAERKNGAPAKNKNAVKKSARR